MKILEKIIINEKEYICIQKLWIQGNIIYMCQEQKTKQVIYLKENKDNGQLEQTEDENPTSNLQLLTSNKKANGVKYEK